MTIELDYNYPNELHDEDGYPTQEALDYIKNWSIDSNNGEVKMGKHFGKANYNELIDYIKSIWTYKDAIEYENGLLEIHTYGWSGNEDIIHELKNTDMWDLKFRCERTGGHYYFKVTDDNDFDWVVIKFQIR
jgi:hypothetical protein